MTRRLLAVSLIAGLLAAWGAPRASAHATLERATPGPHASLARPPALLLLFFDEAIELRFSRVTVTANDGGADLVAGPMREIRDEVVVPLRPGSIGTYTVRWRMLSGGDGHVVQGAFSFGVGVSAAAPAPLPGSGPPVGDDILRWLIFLGLSLAGGALVVRATVWRPALAEAGPPEEEVTRGEWKRSAVVALVGAGVALHADLYAFLTSAHSVTGGSLTQFADAQIQPLRADTRFGLAWTWTTFVWLAVVALIVLAWIGNDRRRESFLAGAGALALVGGLGLSTSGHAAAASPLRTGADFLHLVAAALWMGGLFELAAIAITTRRLPAETRRALASAVVRRFSSLALWLVLALAAAGLYLAAVQARWPAGFGTAWGAALIAKSALAAGALGLGAFHRWRVVPRLRSGGERSVRAVSTTLAVEAALVAAALLAAALLTNQPPRG
jgi:copper transport protein